MSAEERETVSLGLARGHSLRTMATVLRRAPSTVSREHAAMSPRYLGCRVVIVRSFARIAETNLKKQGILPLTFTTASDYDLIEQGDRISVTGLGQLAPGKPVTVVLPRRASRQ